MLKIAQAGMKSILGGLGVVLAIAVSSASPRSASAPAAGDPWAECMAEVLTCPGATKSFTCLTQSCAKCWTQHETRYDPYSDTVEVLTWCYCGPPPWEGGGYEDNCCDLVWTRTGKVRTRGSCSACNEPGTCHVVTEYDPELDLYRSLPACGV